MIDPSKIVKAVGRLATLKYFPSSDEDAREMLMDMLARMVSTEEQLAWLVDRAVDTLAEWTGPAGLRTLFVSRFASADGIDPAFPGEDRRRIGEAHARELEYRARLGLSMPTTSLPQLETRAPRLLTGHVEPVSADPVWNAKIREVASEKDLNAMPEVPWSQHDLEIRAALEGMA